MMNMILVSIKILFLSPFFIIVQNDEYDISVCQHTNLMPILHTCAKDVQHLKFLTLSVSI